VRYLVAPGASRSGGEMGRRGFGYLRRLPSKRYQASYIGPDLARHVEPGQWGSPVRRQTEMARTPPSETRENHVQRWLSQRRVKGDRRRPAPSSTMNARCGSRSTRASVIGAWSTSLAQTYAAGTASGCRRSPIGRSPRPTPFSGR